MSWEVISQDTGLSMLKSKLAGHPRERQGLWEMLAAQERGRDGGGAAVEERGSHTSQSQDPG